MDSYQIYRVKNIFFGRRKMNLDSFWTKCQVLTSFVLPWNSEIPPATIFRALYDAKRFYFRFDVIDTDIIVNRESNDKMAVLKSDRVEIFFRSDKKMKPYYGIEMDPLGRVLDYKAEHYRVFDYSWKWDGITIRAAYTLNGYRVWGCIPLDLLKEMNLLHDHKLQVGLFRGKCLMGPDDEVSFKWISWVKPESDTPDFHIPSAFGELNF